MTCILRYLCILCCVALCLPLVGEEDADVEKDVMIQTDGRIVKTFIQRELAEHLEHKVVASMARAQEKRYRELRGFSYAEMNQPGSYWLRAQTFERDGDYAKAAQYYKQLYQGGGEVEWKLAYGLYGVGLMLERLGRYADSTETVMENDEEVQRRVMGAASIWQAFIEEFPEHRLKLNAMYHAGVCLAKVGKEQEAEALVAQLKELSRGRAARAAESRMKAIEAMMALVKGGMDEANRRARSVRFTFEDQDQFIFGDKDVWLHWSLLWGSALEDAKQWDEAASHYEDVLEKVITDPAKSAELLLKVAKIQIKANKADAALEKLLRLDMLPVGGGNQQAEARLLAANIMLDQVGKLKDEFKQARMLAIGNMVDGVAKREGLSEELTAQLAAVQARLPQPKPAAEEAPAEEAPAEAATE